MLVKLKRYTDQDNIRAIVEKRFEDNSDVKDVVFDIIKNVRVNKDKALFLYMKKFDGFDIDNSKFVLYRDDIIKLYEQNKASSDLEKILNNAALHIKRYHVSQMAQLKNTVGVNMGSKVGWRYTSLDSVGIYVPGGKAAYPSSVLMVGIPAFVARVKNIVMATPRITNPLVLYAALIVGVNKIYVMGGAHAIAALANGTESVDKVDLIAGPGNKFVAEAKRQVYGTCGIDMVAGPTEVLIFADGTANPRYIACDMLAQAEHDERAATYLVTTSNELACKVEDEISKLLDENKNFVTDSVKGSLENNAYAIVCKDVEGCYNVANIIAPEHLEILIESNNVPNALRHIKHAGAIFVGEYSPEVVGDYFAGPSHCLPTNSTARFSSALSVSNFMKRTSIIEYSKEEFFKSQTQIAEFARAEGLNFHMLSSLIREDK